MFRHLVLFRVHDAAEDAVVAEAVERLRSLSDAEGLLGIAVEVSSDQRKGRIIVEDLTFESREAFERFRSSSRHAAVAKFLATMSDWWIGDYESS